MPQRITHRITQLAGAFSLLAGTACALRAGERYRRENRLIEEVVEQGLGRCRIDSREDLASLAAELRARIRIVRLTGKRPLLRASAARTLEVGEGGCGEMARVAVRTLRRGGVRANRIYLWGTRWGHVSVEHLWDGRWCLFDASPDIGDLMSPGDFGTIDSDDVAAFPNRNATTNPWTVVARARFLRRGPTLCHLRPPGVVTSLAESPELVYVGIGLAAVAAGSAMVVAGSAMVATGRPRPVARSSRSAP